MTLSKTENLRLEQTSSKIVNNFYKIISLRFFSLGLFYYIYTVIKTKNNMNYKNFNRHEVFNCEDLDNVREAIKNLGEKEKAFTSIENSLWGLYDGYLYEGLDEELYQILDFKVFCNLTKTLKKIVDHIKSNGESITLV